MRLMRRLAAMTVRFVEGLYHAHTIGRIVPAGWHAGRLAGSVAVVGTLLAVGAYALSSPGSDDGGDQTSSQASPGGESVVSKFAQSKFARTKFAPSKFAKSAQVKSAQVDSAQLESEAAVAAVTANPTPASRLLAMALAPEPVSAPPRTAEPNLEGLSEIPQELIWNRPPDEEDDAKPTAFAAFSKAREELPWDATEPVPFSPLAPGPVPVRAKAKPSAVLGPPINLPKGGQVETWMRAKATEIKGADRTRPLFHFEFWLEPPAEMRRRLVGVAYDFSTPAIRPQSQASSDQASGFRISAGGLACADEITLTLTFDDGRAQKVAVDGCKLLS